MAASLVVCGVRCGLLVCGERGVEYVRDGALFGDRKYPDLVTSWRGMCQKILLLRAVAIGEFSPCSRKPLDDQE